MPKLHTLVFQVTQEAKERMESLVQRTGAENLRCVAINAFSTYDFLITEVEKGRRIFIEEEDGTYSRLELKRSNEQEAPTDPSSN